MIVSVIQLDIEWGNPLGNRERIESLIKLEKQKPDLIVLPEMFSTGFSMDPETVAETMEQDTVKWMVRKSIEFDTAIIGSIAIKENGHFYNRMLFVYPNGDIKHYDKRHLFRMGGEDKVYSGGEDTLIVEYKGWRIRPLVCYDLRFPVWSRNTISAPYDLLIYIASWPEVRANVWNTLIPARAIENQSYAIGCNRVGDDPKLHYAGGSAIYNYMGNSIASAENEKESVTTISLDLNAQNRFRERFPAWLDADNFILEK